MRSLADERNVLSIMGYGFLVLIVARAFSLAYPGLPVDTPIELEEEEEEKKGGEGGGPENENGRGSAEQVEKLVADWEKKTKQSKARHIPLGKPVEEKKNAMAYIFWLAMIVMPFVPGESFLSHLGHCKEIEIDGCACSLPRVRPHM